MSDIANFPPFYTRQPTLETWRKQQSLWSEHILAYCKQNRIFRIFFDQPIALFENKSIGRKVSRELFDGVVEYMLAQQQLIPVAESGSARKQQNVSQQYFVLWLPFEQWTQELLKWAADVGAMSSTIYTVFELLDGDQTGDCLFSRMDPEMFLLILEFMERRQTVQLLRTSSDIKEIGVKFK